MPSLQEIERFKGILNSLGSEAEILAERGEAIEDLPPPEAGPPDLSDLFEGAPPPPPGPGAPPGPQAPQGREPPRRPAEAAAGPEEGEGTGAEPGGQDIDFGDLLGPGGAEELDKLQAPAAGTEEAEGAGDLDEMFAGLGMEPEAAAPTPTPAAAEPAPSETAADEEAAAKTLEEFGIPPGLLESLGETGQAEAGEAALETTLPEPPFPEAGAEPAAQEAADFTLPAEFMEQEAGPQAPAMPEGLELPEAPEVETPAAEAAAPPGAGEVPVDIFAGPQAPEPPQGEELQLPEDFLAGLGEAPAAAAEAEPAAEAGPAEAPPGPGEGLGEAPFQLPEEFQLPPEAPVGEAPVGEAPAGEAPAEAPLEGPPESEALPGAPAEEPFAFPEMPPIETGEAGVLPPEPPLAPLPGEVAPPAAGEEGISALPEGFAGEGLFEEEMAGEAAVEAPVEAPPEAPPGPPRQAMAGQAEAPPPEGQVPAGEEEFTLSERRFAALQRTLVALPRNLKIAIEEIIAERGLTGPDLRLLTDLLADGAAPARLAEEASRILGRRIRLPRGYEKLTGLAFEEERRRFGFALRENVWPVVRAAVLSLLFLGLLSFVGYRFIYRPVTAWVLYRQGHAQILKDRYKLAEERFAKANAILRYKRWYLRYAEAYEARRQYALAADKFELLLRNFPLDRQGTLAYAHLLTYSTFGYERADRVLGEYTGEYEVDRRLQRFVPRKGFRDAGILLARGDNFLEWAEEKPEYFESARRQYATILDYYGERDEVLLRMMRYFIRVSPQKSRLKETQDLYRLLEEKDKRHRLQADPELLAGVYSELAGFWFDQKSYDGVLDALLAALKRDKFYPETHYQLARYYRYLQDPVEERKALVNAVKLLEDSSPFTRRRLLDLIDSYNRLGESYYRGREYLNAEAYFQRATERIEAGQAQRVLGRTPELGQPYKNRGDIYYYVSRNLATARELYRQAEANLYHGDELDYKLGYIAYAQEDFEQSLLRFSRVVDALPNNENGLFALGNAMYLQGFYASAQGYYLRLLDLQETRRDRISFLQPVENSEHRDLVEFMMKAFNNLGVATMRLSERGGNPTLQARALAELTFSSEYFDVLTRNPVTAERGQTRNLAYLNQRSILYPTRTVELEIYGRLPLDLAASRF
jgi:tetratricopeptide (TPR) repeat protein